MMYSRERLDKFPFLVGKSDAEIFDALTGVISRKNILEMVQYLINVKKEFSMQIVDIDNFKAVNDDHGHNVGDEVLQIIGKSFEDTVGENGYVGRYGGDEFLIIYLGGIDYDSIYTFARYLNTESVLRKNMPLSDGTSVFVTSTIGSSSFPLDANCYSELFLNADKALYRGKLKGRNCFIIYSADKHKNIDVSQKERVALPDAIREMSRLYDQPLPFRERIQNIFSFIGLNNHIGGGVLFDANGYMIASKETPDLDFSGLDLKDLEKNMHTNGLVNISNIFSRPQPNTIYRECQKNDISAIIFVKIQFKDKFFGYGAIFDNVIERVWQLDDEVLLEYLARLIATEAYYIEKEKNK